MGLFALSVTGCPTPPPDAAPDQDSPPAPMDAAPPDSAPPPLKIEPLPPQKAKVQFDDFVGAEECSGCHQAIYDRWARSTHGRAGGPPTEARLLPSRRQRRFSFSDVQVELIRDDKGYAFVLTADGAAVDAPLDRVEVDGVVGAEAMIGGGAQAYVHRTPLGTVVHLPFEYSQRAKTWYCQRRETTGGRVERRWRPIDGSFPLAECGWPAKSTLGYSNYNHCGNCHGSQIQALFDPQAKAYRTRWAGLHINCESCHGPGRRHVTLMQAPPDTHTTDIGLPALDLADKHASTMVCMACHATKRALAPGYLSGDPVDTYFTTRHMDLDAQRDHHPDGRIADFGYQEGHLHSDCFLNGSMTCVDCHDPHAQSYRDPHGRTLTGRFDDGQCLGCHPAKDSDSGHSGHSSGPKAPRCTDCHMPFAQHPAVPNAFRITRSDHVIPIPRPGYDDDLGVENACARCHADRGVGWQMAETRRLFGDLKPHSTSISHLEAVRSGRMTAAEWLLDSTDQPGPNGLIALTLFLADHLKQAPEAVAPDVLVAITRRTRDASVDLRAAAITTLLVLGQSEPEILDRARAALGDRPSAPLHWRVRRYLRDLYTSLPDTHRQRRNVLEGAMTQYAVWTRESGAAHTVAQANAAVDTGDWTRASQLFKAASAAPGFDGTPHAFGAGDGAAFQHHVRAGDMAMAQRRPRDAVHHFSAAQALAPRDTAGKRGHWMSLLASERPAEALAVLEAYLELVPSFTRGHLIRAQILDALGKPDAALESLNRATQLRPRDPSVKAARAARKETKPRDQ